MKRIIDVILALLIFFLSLPLLLFGITLVYLSVGSPIFFTQMRAGLKHRPFKLFKLRTMKSLYDISGDLLSDEQRLTPIGRFLRRSSIDELPQLLNVILGDMSLVGPRPLLMEYVPLYSEEQAKRHDVRPGITGWAQVNGRNALTWEKKFQLDVWYVKNRNLALDFIILVMTVGRVLNFRAVEPDSGVTADRFEGSPK